MNPYEDTQTESAVVADLAARATSWRTVKPGERYAWLEADGSKGELNLSDVTPARKTGVTTVRDVASFRHYFGRHQDGDSEIFADFECSRIVAVLDAHRGAEGDLEPEFQARYQQHRLVLALELTEPWKTWLENDRKFRPQADFAEFIEDNRLDLAPSSAYGELNPDHYPDGIEPVRAADLLEIAQHLQMTIKVTFEAAERLRDGTTTFAWNEVTETTRAGKKGNFTVPGTILLAIAPYEDCSRALVSARLRHRPIRDGGALFGYFLDAPERVRREAVEEIASLVEDATGRAVMRGTPSP